MRCSLINSENYATLVEWYLGWNLPITPYSYIPKTSVIVEDVCAGFLYRMGETPMFWMEGIITNPKIKDKELKAQGISAVVEILESFAKLEGCELLMTSTPRETLTQKLLKMGYSSTPERYFHLGKRL